MESSESNKSKSYRINMRLSENEYKDLSEEAKNLNKSKSDLIRDIIKNKKPTTILMTPKQYDRLLSEFNRVGNNINQLAKKANSGDVVLDKFFSSVQEELRLIYKYIVRFHGLHKNS